MCRSEADHKACDGNALDIGTSEKKKSYGNAWVTLSGNETGEISIRARRREKRSSRLYTASLQELEGESGGRRQRLSAET